MQARDMSYVPLQSSTYSTVMTGIACGWHVEALTQHDLVHIMSDILHGKVNGFLFFTLYFA